MIRTLGLMTTMIFLSSATANGQFLDVYCQPVCTLPANYIYFELDGIRELSRRYECIDYGRESRLWVNVPVINGHVPDVSKKRLSTGGYRIVYDYSSRTRLSECTIYGFIKPRRSNYSNVERETAVPERETIKIPQRNFEPKSNMKRPSEIYDLQDVDEILDYRKDNE